MSVSQNEIAVDDEGVAVAATMRNQLDAYWADRKQHSLRAALNRSIAEKLLTEIYRWSARQKRWGPNAGSWVTEMEYLCWQRQPRLHRLAARAGGWWRWCDGVVFVSRKRWMKMFKVWQRREAAYQILRTTSPLFERLTKRPENGFEKWQAKHAQIESGTP